jgi:hypothetical protein
MGSADRLGDPIGGLEQLQPGKRLLASYANTPLRSSIARWISIAVRKIHSSCK